MTKRMQKPILKILCVCILLLTLCLPVAAAGGVKEVIPGGMPFGVKYYAEGAIVIGVCDVETTTGLISPARDAGLVKGDVITHACGSKIRTLEELLKLVEGCGGQKIEIGYTRNGTASKLNLAPARDRNTGKYRMGVWVRDSTAGIGTVTYIEKDTLQFGGLGHGINDASTGMLMPFGSGTVVEVTIDDIKKGMKNAPGELKGTFLQRELGALSRNTEAGVFGTLEYLPEAGTKTIPVGSAADVKTGKATVRSCASSTVKDYEIEIEEIYTPAGKTKNFLIHVTDPQLLALTGGIVQGMSGSPIIQNGKLIGAVTHVLVNDPTRGYGIFIENMLDAAVAGA